MASAALKMAAAVCMLLLCAGQLIMLASAGRAGAGDAALLRLQELEEEVLEEELALLDDGAGATVCSSNCQKCLLGCGKSCITSLPSPAKFVTCFVTCAFKNKCFSK